MTKFKNVLISRAAMTLVASMSFPALGTAARIEPDALPKYAVAYAKENAASAVTELDGKRVWSFSGAPLDVLAGPHRIEVTTCAEGSTARCAPRVYQLTLLAGRAYFIRSSSLVEVFDRYNTGAGRIDSLQWNGRAFVDGKQMEAEREQRRIAENERLAKQAEERLSNLPRVRKIGARVCQRSGDTATRLGFVEGITDEKIQIRMSDIVTSANRDIRPTGSVRNHLGQTAQLGLVRIRRNLSAQTHGSARVHS